ncbi:MAG: hypothetical protein HYY24_22310 [Verrucomicrobia bacterium]|nr:hypothetical protein [Verrucomicrobiota bacterium]
MIPTPIRQVLSTIRKHQVQALLMGGQACVFYGAAQFSKDVDLAVLADTGNYTRLLAALDELGARRIAVPRFDPAVLARGHAVHFRCRAEGVQGLRVDIMTRLRDLPDVQTMWDRRTTIADEDGNVFELLAVEDLVQAKKTQREKDWPVISALVEGHFRKFQREPTSARVHFWLRESRTPERLCQLVSGFPSEAQVVLRDRPLLAQAFQGDLETLRAALDAEVRAEQAKDRAYWEPLRRELETFRREELQGGTGTGIGG